MNNILYSIVVFLLLLLAFGPVPAVILLAIGFAIKEYKNNQEKKHIAQYNSYQKRLAEQEKSKNRYKSALGEDL